MKPDWKDAPEWAQWLAMDRNGEWYWHELEPEPNEFYGEWVSLGKIQKVNTQNPIWKGNLKQRP